MTQGDRALALLRRLVEHAQWFTSAIELDHDQDGEALWTEARALLERCCPCCHALFIPTHGRQRYDKPVCSQRMRNARHKARLKAQAGGA